jgi:pilus assembly protein Flp/PilA
MEAKATERQGTEREEGATMVEYALMAALVAVVCIAAVSFLGQQVSSQFSRVASTISRSGA